MEFGLNGLLMLAMILFQKNENLHVSDKIFMAVLRTKYISKQ